MDDAVIGSELRLTSMLFLGVVGVVLLIWCANFANLLLARHGTHAGAGDTLGASRGRVTRQLMTETLCSQLLGVLGVGIGVAILTSRLR